MIRVRVTDGPGWYVLGPRDLRLTRFRWIVKAGPVELVVRRG